MICPGTQYPHCIACLSTNARWTGCNSPPVASPSIVRTFLPATSRTGVMHERTAWPSIKTVHAPHSPSPQPYFVPVNCKSSRSTSSSGLASSVIKDSSRPLTVIFSSRRIGSCSQLIVAGDGLYPEVGTSSEDLSQLTRTILSVVVHREQAIRLPTTCVKRAIAGRELFRLVDSSAFHASFVPPSRSA